MRKQKLGVFVALSLAAAGGGCTAIIGLDDVHFTGGTGGSTSSGGSGGAGATGGTTGGGGAGGTTTTVQGGGGTGGTTTTTSTTTTVTNCIPMDDGNPCTSDLCDANGNPVHTPVMVGTPCMSPNGTGKVCDAAGQCVQCVKDSDCASMVCNTGTHTCGTGNCGNGKKTGNEGCDDGNNASGDGCSSTCTVEPGYSCVGDSPSVCSPICGDGVLKGAEACDDNNAMSGDGCSSTCQIEPFFDCTGTPSKCSKHEVLCNDGIDNDADGLMDKADPDCAVPDYYPPCDVGKLHVYRALGAFPLAIPDNSPTGVSSRIHVADPVTVARFSVLYDVTHPMDGDLTFALTRPTGTTNEICSKRGGAGANFTSTLLDSGCDTALLAGVAPFSGCFKPEQPFTDMAGKSGVGAWTMKIVDDSDPHAGTLDGWALVLCAQ
jgi:cysteine-rich repeat protein